MNYRIIWWLTFLGMATPLIWLSGLALTGGLGANPIEFLTRYLGDWALRTLLVALAATPVQLAFGWIWPVRLRRMLGLWAFAYVSLHLANYIAIEQFFDWHDISVDIVKRTYITVGMANFTLLSLLAATSWKGAIKRLGAKTWRRLHTLVYLAGVLGCIHYIMMVKADILPPTIHFGVLGALLGVRVWHRIRPSIKIIN